MNWVVVGPPPCAGESCTWRQFGWCFFFQAEGGIRDWSVTGVQTCALPISHTVYRALGFPPPIARQRQISRLWTNINLFRKKNPFAPLGRELFKLSLASFYWRARF